MTHTEHVLRVDRCMVAGAAGGDDDVVDVVRADRLDERADGLRRATQEPRGDLGLFEDLVAKRHGAVMAGPPGPGAPSGCQIFAP